MTTQSQAVNWLGQQVGKKLDYDHLYGDQCVDFFNFYYQFISGDNPFHDGYAVPAAKNLWGVPNSRFLKLADSPTLLPHPGDVLVYGSSWGGGYGHVEVCESSTKTGSTLVGENEHGNPSEGVVRVFRTWAQMKGLLGVMRPNFAIPQTVASPTHKTLYLPASVTTWRVYPLNKKPVIGNECGYLLPSKYGGLSYAILAEPYPNVYTIQTQSYGTVNIYAGADTPAQIK